MEPRIGEVYKDDTEELYIVREVFTQSCVVCPLVNTELLACEIMEFSSMEKEGWKVLGVLK